jgi:hypothetical protein
MAACEQISAKSHFFSARIGSHVCGVIFAANPLQVFGRTPLFFYVIHVHILAAASWLLNMHRTGGLIETYLATVVALAVLYPLCRWYGHFKQVHPKSLLRYL